MIVRSRRKRASLKTLKIARPIVTLGLAFWIVFLSTAVHGLHQHNGKSCPSCGGYICTVEPSGDSSKSKSPRAQCHLEFRGEGRSDFQLCPACELLKFNSEVLPGQINVRIELPVSEFIDPENTVAKFLLSLVSVSPRAPPLSLTS